MRYVIIGNSAAGIFAAEEIRKLDKTGSIDILTDEKYPVYARCLTSYYLAGDLPEDKLYIRPEGFYQEHNLNLRCGEKVTGLDPLEKVVRTERGDKVAYDKLLIASGSSPIFPALPGIEAKGVFGLRTLEDAKQIAERAKDARRVVVIGGGFVALKAACALLKAGKTVTCLVSSRQVLSQMLDPEAAQLVMDTLRAHGLRIRRHKDAVKIVAKDNGVTGVILNNLELLRADLVIVGKGVKPNVEFLAGSGVNVDQGILVDEYLETSIPGIYAAGDVAQARDAVTGKPKINALWPNAAEQGKLAGRNMAGERTGYPGSVAMNAADFFDLSVIAGGLAKAEGPDYEVLKGCAGDKGYRRLVFKEERLVGYILAGDTAAAGMLTELIRQGKVVRDKEQLFVSKLKQSLFW